MSKPKRKYSATFLSPGSFVAEQSSISIDSDWQKADVAKIIPDVLKKSEGITERYGSKPFGFYFATNIVSEPIDDGEGGTLDVSSKEVARSGIYYINGKLYTYDDVVERNDPKEDILRSNMSCNSYGIIVETKNSYKHAAEFNKDDFVVNSDGVIVERGTHPKWLAYQINFQERMEAKNKEDMIRWEAEAKARKTAWEADNK